MNPLINYSNSITMSSREIAMLCDKRHDNVVRDIEIMFDELGIGALSFEATYLDGSNRQSKCYQLPKQECLILVTGYSTKLRAAIIIRWQELEFQLKSIANQTSYQVAMGDFSAYRNLAKLIGLDDNEATLNA